MIPRVRLKLQTSLVAIAILALLISGFAQIEQARQEERFYRRAMMRTLPLRRVKSLFSEPGIAILRSPSRIETFRVLDAASVSATPEAWATTRLSAPFGLEPGQAPLLSSRIAEILLDGAHYFDADDRPTPRVGIRFRKGRFSLELVLGEDTLSHLDVWAFIRGDRGEVVHAGGRYCIESPALRTLVEEALAASHPVPSPDAP